MILYKFSAPWCESCNRMGIILSKLLPQYPELEYIEIDVETPQSKELRVKYSVRSIPTFILLEDGAMIDRVEGEFSLEQGKNWLDDQLGITLKKERQGKLPKVT